MTITISSVAKAAVEQMFAGLEGVLKKGAAAAKAQDVEDAVYLNWRLAPDMHPFVRQVRTATEGPTRALSRLAGVDCPTFADDEETFAALLDRLAKARDHIKSLHAEALDANPEGPISFPIGPGEEMNMTRLTYLQKIILPNFYFHVTAAYLILRTIGVDVGKRDYLAASSQL